jgi:hypothetical protein
VLVVLISASESNLEKVPSSLLVQPSVRELQKWKKEQNY